MPSNNKGLEGFLKTTSSVQHVSNAIKITDNANQMKKHKKVVSWVCSCGVSNTTKFTRICGGCGKEAPEELV